MRATLSAMFSWIEPTLGSIWMQATRIALSAGVVVM
jgi:hypothetical protein